MALVSYASSDSEADDQVNSINEEVDQSSSNEELNGLDNKIDQLNKSDDELQANDFLKLPQPSTTNKSKLIGTNLLTSKSEGKVKIFLPSYKKNDDEFNEENDNEREFKRFKYENSKGSGLKSLLPPPKNQSSVKSTSFVPDVLKRKTTELKSKVSSSRSFVKSALMDDEDESINFFSFDQDNVKLNNKSNDLKTNANPVMSNKFETDLIKNRYADLSIKPTSSSNSISQQAIDTSATDYQIERKLKYEIEKKFGAEIGDEIRIQDVNIANHLTENLDYIKSVSEERQQDVKGPLPSSIAKRKHQITYLAFQAKQNEIKLKNEWAQGKINRDQARSKYGF